MEEMSIAALQPITPEQHFKNACSAIHDPTMERFMRCLPDIQSGEAMQIAEMVVKHQRPEWRVQLLAVVRQFPHENYEQVCSTLVSNKCFKEVLEVLQSSPKTWISHSTESYFVSLFNEIACHPNKPYVSQLTNLMFERVQKLPPYLLFDLATKMKNSTGTLLAIQKMNTFSKNKLQPTFLFFEKAVGVDSGDVIDLVRTQFNTPQFNLNLVEAICYNDEVDFLDHLKECLDNIPQTKKSQMRLNDCLERSVSYENIERVTCLLPYYRPTYEDGYTLMTASATGNKAIFDLLADLTPRPDKILVSMEEEGPSFDFEDLALLRQCVEERAQIKQRDKMLKVIAKRTTSSLAARRKM